MKPVWMHLLVPPRRSISAMYALAHDPRPDPAGRAELRDLLEEVAVDVEEERELPREVIDVQAALHRRVRVRDRVGEGEGELLDRGRARFADVVARDRDRVPLR